MSSVPTNLPSNGQPLPTYNCTLDTCPIEDAYVGYVPSLAGNALFLALFTVMLFIQLFLGIRYRTWGFLVATISGMILEVVGYIGRIRMHFNPFLFDNFLQ